MIDFQSFVLLFVNNFSYLGIFLFLAIIAILPIPEEIILLLIGYFAGFGFADLNPILLSGTLGVLVGDNLLFFLSRHSSQYVNKYKKKLAPKIFTKYEKLMHDHIGKSIFLLRFIMGLRFLGPILAGSSKVKWIKFLFFNSLAVVIFAPFFIYMGYYFNTALSLVIKKLFFIKHFILIIILILFTFGVIMFIKKKFIKKENKEKNPSA